LSRQERCKSISIDERTRKTDKRDTLDNGISEISADCTLSRKRISNSYVIIDLEIRRRRRLPYFIRDSQFNLPRRVMFQYNLVDSK
jgi:hypothetical protein